MATLQLDRSDMLSQLNDLVFDGIEFPDAFDIVVNQCGLNTRQADLLKQDYDDQD